MSDKHHVTVAVALDEPNPGKGRRPRAEERLAAVAQAIVRQVLPTLAGESGVDKERLAAALLAELGYDVGRSHAPAAAMDVLAVATERLRDGLVDRGSKVVRLPIATVRGPRTLQ